MAGPRERGRVLASVTRVPMAQVVVEGLNLRRLPVPKPSHSAHERCGLVMHPMPLPTS